MGRWLENYGGFIPSLGLDNVYGCGHWKALFGGCIPDPDLDSWFHVPRTHAFLLHGPAGNGKCTLALGLAGELTKIGYRFIHIPAMALAGEEGQGAVQNMEELFEEILAEIVGQEKTGFCLLLEWLGDLAKEEEAMWVLNRYIAMMKEADIPCVILATMEEIFDVHSFLRKSMVPCYVGLPDEKERRLCLEQVTGERFLMAPGISCKKMAEMTEGFTYGKLCNLAGMAALVVKQKARKFSGGDRGRLAQLLKNGQILFTEEMFQEVLRQFDMGKREEAAGRVYEVHPAYGSEGPVQGVTAAEAAEAGRMPFGGNGNFNEMSASMAESQKELTEEKDFLSSMMEMDLDEL